MRIYIPHPFHLHRFTIYVKCCIEHIEVSLAWPFVQGYLAIVLEHAHLPCEFVSAWGLDELTLLRRCTDLQSYGWRLREPYDLGSVLLWVSTSRVSSSNGKVEFLTSNEFIKQQKRTNFRRIHVFHFFVF